MKKVFFVLIAIVCFGMTMGHAQKYGHVSINDIFMAMPGADTLQTSLQSYQNELESEYNSMVEEFKTKYAKLEREAGTMSSTVLTLRQQELNALQERISAFEQSLQDIMQEKQIELMTPFQDKILQAIKDVAKENGYVYIFDTKNLLYADENEDVSALVKKKLGIK